MPIVWSTGISALDELNDLAITSGATNDILQRNSSGIYVNRQPVGTETSQTLNSGAANDTVPGANVLRGDYLTLPTTAPLWRITGIEWKNGTVVNGTSLGYVFSVDANPAVSVFIATVAHGADTQTGASSVQRVGPTQLFSSLVPGGTVLFAAVATASATGRYLTATVSSANNSKGITAGNPPIIAQGGAWTATTEAPYMKVYYKPVLGV